MPSSVKRFSWAILLWAWQLAPGQAFATDLGFGVGIRHAQLSDASQHAPPAYTVEARIDYQLSPTAKDALLKGVALTWMVDLQIREIGRWYDAVVYARELPYTLQFHALLNQYEVTPPTRQSEMYLTLNAALNFMSGLQGLAPIPAALFQPGKRYKLALKIRFDRETLPVPLRPFAYLDSQWSLSSAWFICPIPK
ncbi:DUF4390 domain-containing protein [Methylomonas sp. HYX-M1]|uniref:DUF4390 domain-containing protein n=1 Tax=Methylomonas sp. HYX-M1 TaxID=3139307 RepID=UPI00345B7656